jgi:hypothetical protein
MHGRRGITPTRRAPRRCNPAPPTGPSAGPHLSPTPVGGVIPIRNGGVGSWRVGRWPSWPGPSEPRRRVAAVNVESATRLVGFLAGIRASRGSGAPRGTTVFGSPIDKQPPLTSGPPAGSKWVANDLGGHADAIRDAAPFRHRRGCSRSSGRTSAAAMTGSCCTGTASRSTGRRSVTSGVRLASVRASTASATTTCGTPSPRC